MTFQVDQITSTVHRVADGLVNWYLVDEDGEVAIYDAGWPRSWPHVEGALRQLGRSPGDVSAVVLTHGHPDHLGAAEKIRQETGATVHAHETEVARTHGKAKGSSPFSLVPSLVPTLWRPRATEFVLHATVRGFMTPKWVKDVTPFAADAVLDVPGRPRAVATPGHTEGHVSFVLGDSGVVITGDAITTLDVLTRTTGPRLMPDALNGDPDRTRASLDVLAGLAVDILLPGHGDPFKGDPADAVARAKEADR